MPYLPHALLTFGGSWTDPEINEEIWVTGCRFTSDWGNSAGAGAPSEAWQDTANEASTKLATFFASTHFSNKCSLEWVKFNPIGADGKYQSGNFTFVNYLTPPLTGTQTQQLLPLQNTRVVTLRTPFARGLASRGRMFLPGVTGGQIGSTNGLMTSSYAVSLATAVRDLLVSLRTWSSGYPGVPAVASQGLAGGAGPGITMPVTSVEVGRVVDTQRRRRNKLSELPVASLLPELT
jgi:hypothetical protein